MLAGLAAAILVLPHASRPAASPDAEARHHAPC
jgi:hypothetical protein